MMLLTTLKFIYNHPFNRDHKIRALIRYILWQIKSTLHPNPIVHPYTQHSKLLVRKGLTGATGNVYCGLMDYQDMSFLLHVLRPGDVFFDIGANVGAYTVLASAEIGAKTVAIEPAPSTFQYLSDNVRLNKIEDKVQLLNMALGSDSGTVKFTRSLDTINHIAAENETDTMDVPVGKMDDIDSPVPVLIKIDVEGYETGVLQGAKNILSDQGLKAIIIELNGFGNQYGFNEQLTHESLLALGFKTYRYDPDERKLTATTGLGSRNTTYIRNESFVLDRIATARKIKIGRKEI